jgi:hypothetical protein
MIFNFFSSKINTDKYPACPRCERSPLERHLSVFSSPKTKGEMEESPVPGMDEAMMEKAIGSLAREAEGLDENDPRQAANLMRRMTEMTGLKLGAGMEDALRRMEAGDDPEQIEAEMGDLLESEEPFEFLGARRGRLSRSPVVDDKLYDL